MTSFYSKFGRLLNQAQDASIAVDRMITVGVVERVVPQVDESGDPNGLLYDVRIFSRRARPYILRHVASAVPVQVGHEVFVVQVAGQHSRGGWVVGTAQPPVPQTMQGTADISPFGTYVSVGPSLPVPTVDRRIVRVEDAITVTAARMRVGFALELPPAPGRHDVDETTGANPTRSGSYSGVTVQWEVSALLLDSGNNTLGVATHGFVAQGAVTSVERIQPNPAGLASRWRYSEQLLSPRVQWSRVFDTGPVLGEPVHLEIFLVGPFYQCLRVQFGKRVGFLFQPGPLLGSGRGLRQRPARVADPCRC